MERGALCGASRAHLKHLAYQGSGAFGNAATRLNVHAQSGRVLWIKDPQIDAWYAAQANARDPSNASGCCTQIQRKLYEEARFLPIWEIGFLCAGAQGWEALG